MLTQVIIILVLSLLFPAVGYYLDWKHNRKKVKKEKTS